jgi:hypothetical protein
VTVLELAKSGEKAEAIFLVMEDYLAKKIMVAWTLCKTGFKDAQARKGETADEARERSWLLGSPVDMVALSELADVPLLTTKDKFWRMQAAGIVYPDGSLHKIGYNLLRAEVGSYIRMIAPRRAIGGVK